MMSSIIEYSNGEEVSVSLRYERLEKHCAKCYQLDHELKDWLEAKHRLKALKAMQETSSKSMHHSKVQRKNEECKTPNKEIFQFSASKNSEMGSKLPFRNHYRKDSFERDSRYRPRSPDPKARTNQRKWRPKIHQSHVSERRGLDRSNFKGIERNSNRERHLHVPDTSSRSREYPNSKQLYREVSRAQNNARREETGDTPKYRSPPFRGAPLRSEHTTKHQDALEEILGEGRQAMVQ